MFAYTDDANVSVKEIVNWKGANGAQVNTGNTTMEFNGFSICEITDAVDYDYVADVQPNNWSGMQIEFLQNENASANRKCGVGSISYGSIFDMPFSADLQMTLRYDFGHTSVDAKSGKTFINRSWWQKPKWTDYQPPWSLDKIDEHNLMSSTSNDMDEVRRMTDPSKAGRRVYNLTFSFLSDDQLFATNPNVFTTGMGDAEHLGEILTITGNVAAITGLDFATTSMQIQRSFSAGIGAADLFRERAVRSLLGFQAGAEVSVEETIAKFREKFGKGGQFGQTTDELADTLSGTLSGTLSCIT